MAVGFGGKTACGAGPGGVGGVNEGHHNPGQLGLIGDEVAELGKGPGVLAAPLPVINRCPAPDPPEFLEGNQAPSVFRLRHQPLADHMVGIPSEVGLYARELLEMPLCGFSPLALKGSRETVGALPDPIHILAGVEFPITVNRQVNDAEVDPQGASRVIRRRLRGIECDCQVEGAFSQDKVALLDHPVDAGLLVDSHSHRDYDAPLQGQDGDPVEALPGEDPVIIDHGPVGLECNPAGFVPSVSLGDLAHCPHRHLGREAEVLPKITVGKMVEFDLSRRLVLIGKTGEMVARLIEALHGLKQGIMLLRGRGELDQERLNHTLSIEQSSLHVNRKEVRAASSAT